MDPQVVYIAIGVAFVAVVLYLVVMRVFYRDSRALDEKIDFSKMRKWKDDDD